MKLGIDMTCVGEPFSRDTGKNKVIFNLLHGFRELGYASDIVVFAYDFLENSIRRVIPGSKIITFCPVKIKRTLQNIFISAFQIPVHLHRNSVDLIFSPKSSSGVRKYKIPSVVLPHDIQSISYPSRYSYMSRLIQSFFYNMDFRLRDKVIAISLYDKNEIAKYYPQWAHKIKMIYNPVIFANANIEAKDHDVPITKPYILTINIAFKHKNTITLLKAFNKIKHKIAHNLVLVGNTSEETKHLERYVEDENLSGRVLFTGYIDDIYLNKILLNCDLYVNASYYEGFGMTPIEAMGAGVPVISSRETALLETTCGLAYYYEPAQDHNALAYKIIQVLLNPPEQNDLDEIRANVRANYDYRKIAGDYWDFFSDQVKQHKFKSLKNL